MHVVICVYVRSFLCNTDPGARITNNYVMHINGGRTHRPYLYQLCGVLLKSVTQERYLGVILTQSLSWSNHISQVSVKANQKLGFIKRNLKGSPQLGAKATGLHYLGTIRHGIRKPGVGPQHQQGPGRPRESPKESRPLDY